MNTADAAAALQAPWSAPADRADPVALIEQQERHRLPWLLPLRHARMAESPFACFRGAAAVMAADLGGRPRSGLEVQLCGDAHLLNFGFYASPERTLLFDLNDFDETLPGPFEWDLQRLLASLVLAARQLDLSGRRQERIARHAARAYRKAMRQLAALPWLVVWNQLMDIDALLRDLEPSPFRSHLETVCGHARLRDSRQAVRKLCETEPDGRLRFRHDPPLIWRHDRLPTGWGSPEPLERRVRHAYDTYLASLRPEIRRLLSPFRIVDTASKVVGVGSVGTHCSVGLLLGPGEDDVLVIQSKEAEVSVLAPYCSAAAPDHQGQRVVQGQRLMQTASDPFLGWSNTLSGAFLYWRHFRDWKGSVAVEALDEEGLRAYGRLCAATLAKAHARSGDRGAIALVLEDRERFEAAMAAFACGYADQAEADHELLLAAIASGRLQVGDAPQT